MVVVASIGVTKESGFSVTVGVVLDGGVEGGVPLLVVVVVVVMGEEEAAVAAVGGGGVIEFGATAVVVVEGLLALSAARLEDLRSASSESFVVLVGVSGLVLVGGRDLEEFSPSHSPLPSSAGLFSILQSEEKKRCKRLKYTEGNHCCSNIGIVIRICTETKINFLYY